VRNIDLKKKGLPARLREEGEVKSDFRRLSLFPFHRSLFTPALGWAA